LDLLSLHATSLKTLIRYYGRSVTITDLSDNTYTATALWNFADYAVRLDNVSNPIGDKNSIYIDQDTLHTLGIKPAQNWKITGSPNDYEDEKTYLVSMLPKTDHQLPGTLLFLTPETLTAEVIPMPET
jgi:hypothetical protein